MKKLDKRLVRGLPRKQEQEFRESWIESTKVRARLITILEQELNDSYKNMGNKDNYFMPAWSEYQAKKLGEQAKLRDVIKLLKAE